MILTINVILSPAGNFNLVSSPKMTSDTGKDVILRVLLSPETSAVSMEIWLFRQSELIYLYKYGQEAVYENRVDLSTQELEKGNLSITLKSVQKTDSGDYTCMIFYDGSVKSTKIHLQVRGKLNDIFMVLFVVC